MALVVTLVSAEEEVWHGEASLVVAKTVEGEIGFMTGHEPVLAILAEGQVRITETSGTKVIAAPMAGGPFVAQPDGSVTTSTGRGPRALDQAWNEQQEKPAAG